MSVYTYKCPNCAASLVYNPNKEKLTCNFCKSEFTNEEIQKYLKDNPDKIEMTVEEFEESELSEENEINQEIEDNISQSQNESTHIKGYFCNNCAAEVVTDDTTLTTFCYYCHSPVVITDRIGKDFRPDKVIPFKYDKKEATEKFLSWAKRHRYVKKDFYSENQLEKITGIYLPYWLVDSKFNLDLSAKGYKTEVKNMGDRKRTTRSDFDIEKNGEVVINNIDELAYSKVDKNLLESILPYDMEELKDFEVFYLNGFFSETYDINKETVSPIIENKIQNYKESLVKNILNPYDKVNLIHQDIQDLGNEWKYALLPTWMLTYKYNDKIYVYTMNGQNGKIFGELPIDNSIVQRDARIAGIVVFILALLGGYFLW